MVYIAAARAQTTDIPTEMRKCGAVRCLAGPSGSWFLEELKFLVGDDQFVTSRDPTDRIQFRLPLPPSIYLQRRRPNSQTRAARLDPKKEKEKNLTGLWLSAEPERLFLRVSRTGYRKIG